MSAYIDFTVSRSDFDIDGLFPICEQLDIEFSTSLHGFQIESVRVEHADGSLHPVPSFISDYVASWSLTAAGRRIIRQAHEAERAKLDESREDDRAEWGVQFLPAA